MMMMMMMVKNKMIMMMMVLMMVCVCVPNFCFEVLAPTKVRSWFSYRLCWLDQTQQGL